MPLTNAQVDAAIPVAGTPSRTLTNAALKDAIVDIAGKTATGHTHAASAVTDFATAADARVAAASINALADVTITAPNNTQFLKYNGTEWVNAANTGGAWGGITGTLSAQTDLQAAIDAKTNVGHTHVSSAVSDFNSAVDGRIGAASINALGDVIITAPATSQVIKYDGVNWINAADATGSGGATVADNPYGDITVTVAGTVWTIPPNRVTLAKMSNLAQDQFIGRVTAGAAGVPETTTITAAARSVLDDVSADAMLTTLGGATFTGTGGVARATSPTFVAPTISGISVSDGANVTTAAVVAALAVDTTKGLSTKTVAVDSTFTFVSAPVTANTWFHLLVTNSAAAPIRITLPLCTEVDSGLAAAHVVVISAAGTVLLPFQWNGTVYLFHGAKGFVNKYDATVSPSATDDVTKGYGPGSIWLNGTGNVTWINKSNSAGAAVWNALGGAVSDGFYGDVRVTLGNWAIEPGAVTFAKMANLATDKLIGRDTAATGVPEAIGVTGGIEFDGALNIRTSAFTGDVTKAAGGTATTIAPAVVTLAKMADIATASFIGRTTAATGVPEALTATQATAMLNPFTSVLKGLVPASGGGTTAFLRADGVFTTPAGGGTVTNSGNLTLNSLVLGTGVADTKVVAGIVSDGVSKVTLGAAGVSVGGLLLANATSGTVEIRPVAGALGTAVLTAPAVTDTLVGIAAGQTLTNKTLTSPAITTPAITGGTTSGTLILDGWEKYPVNVATTADLGASTFAAGVLTGYDDVVILNVTTTLSSTTATTTTTEGIKVGAVITGNANIPAATVSSITNATTFVMSAAATAAGTAVATTFTQTIAALTVDGVAPALNARVLVKNQPSNSQNGPYNVTQQGSTTVPWVLTRAADANSSINLASAVVGVNAGTVNAGTLWVTRYKSTDTLNASAVTWLELKGDAAARTQTCSFSVLIGTVANQDYKIVVKAPFGGTVTNLTTISTGGTCTLTGKINTTALGGTANAASVTETTQAHATANAFAVGDDIVLTASANAACLNMSATVEYTRVYA